MPLRLPRHASILSGTKNNKIVIPSSLESEVIKIGHEGHQSTEKVKQLLEMYVWFPNMASKIDKLSKSCLACQANADKKNFHPLQMSDLPSGTWIVTSMDFYGPLPDGTYLLVLICEFVPKLALIG